MKSIGITEFRRHMSKVLKILKATKGVIRITRRGKPVAVVMNMKVFGKLDHDRRFTRLLAQEGKGAADKPLKIRNRELEELVAGITEKNRHKEFEW